VASVMWNVMSSWLGFVILLNNFAVVSGRKVSSGSGSVVKLWQEFFANPREWWDNRMTKVNY